MHWWVSLPALGHDWSGWAHVDATCTTGGYDERTCNRCGATERQNETSPLGHDYGTDNICSQCGLALLLDNSANDIDALAGSQRDVLIGGRSIYRDGDWNTLCLPFAMTSAQIAASPLAGSYLMELDGSKSNLTDGTLTLSFTEATSIEAGKPYILKWPIPVPNFTIGSDEDWVTFTQEVNSGNDSFAGKLVKLTADISVSAMAGTADHPFQGTFDGDGHTMTLGITDTENQGTAPFRYISGATIQYVKTDGTVTGNLHCAGLVGFAQSGTNSIANCEVAASIDCRGGNHSHCGGILGHGLSSTTTISDCLFSGTISGPATATGIIYGWGDGGGTHTIVNCLSAGDYTGCGGIELLRKDNGTEVITNCYRKTGGGSQGTDASGMSNSELVAALGSGWEENGEAVLPKDGKRPPVASPLFQGVTITSTTPAPATSSDGKVTFVGQYDPIEVTEPDRYIMLGSGNTLGYAAAGNTLRPFRAHFEIPASSTVKSYNISFGSGASSVENSKFTNSKFKTDTDDAWYSLDGRKLPGKPTKKGIYIHNDKKVAM